MIVKYKRFEKKYNQITSIHDPISHMDFGIIKLKSGESYTNSASLERAVLLVEGDIEFYYKGIVCNEERSSFLDENPSCIHLPKDMELRITARKESELVYVAVYNENTFEPRAYLKDDCVTEQFGRNVLNNTSLRCVRTVIDDNIAPYSNFVIGEVINYPGRWSSYPPHHHIQPEIYYYRLFPQQGFGFSCEGEEVYKVYDRDTEVIEGGKVHPQVAAPGYAMYYVWVIPHIPKRWRRDRVLLEKDVWMLEDDAKTWPEKKE